MSDALNNSTLQIPFSNSVYQFNFNSFDLPYQNKINYSYLLEGFEEVWHTEKSRSATYTNLSPGKYTFHVKASTTMGLWNSKTTQITFKILPAWWQTIWFKVAIFLLLTGITVLIWIESLKRAKLKHLVEIEKNEQVRLKEVNQMKLQFFTNISHELRTPLTLIYSPLKKMVAQNISVEEIKRGLPGLYRNARRMKDMVDQILEFRKAEMDELHLNQKNYDFIRFCREVIDSFHFMAQTEGVQFKFVHVQETLFFDFDRDKFFKIMFNLISNALKHAPKNSTIVLDVKQDKEWVFIAVSDTGKGIPESKLETVFERYYQVENDVEGTGIGLALTKKLVNLHKGEIWAESTLGEYCTLNVKVPFISQLTSFETDKESAVLTKQEFQHSKESQKTLTPNKSNESILIIEDDWELRHYLKTEFSSNFKVFTASNGKSGLVEAIEKMPDVIVSDVMMPELNGYEFCKALKDDLRISHIPVVLLTAKTMAENQIEGYKSGADLYVSKPFDKDILLSQVESILNNRELLKKRFSHDLGFKVEDVTHSKTDEKLLQKAISIVEMNIQNTQFDVNTFVDKLGISRTLAYKKIKAISGKSINDFILTIRLQNAAVFLLKTDKVIFEIALECGFNDHSYFSAIFKKHFDISPSEYRQSTINGTSENSFLSKNEENE